VKLSGETDFAARATWDTAAAVPVATNSARLAHEFTISPSNQGPDVSTNTVATDQETTPQGQLAVQTSSEADSVVQKPTRQKPTPQMANSIVQQYDQNSDGEISVAELGEAGQDFAADELTIEELAKIGQEFANN
jgi:hypothetical protein